MNLKHIKHSERMQVLEIHINIFISIKNKIVIQVHDITLEFGTVPAMGHDLTLEFGTVPAMWHDLTLEFGTVPTMWHVLIVK